MSGWGGGGGRVSLFPICNHDKTTQLWLEPRQGPASPALVLTAGKGCEGGRAGAQENASTAFPPGLISEGAVRVLEYPSSSVRGDSLMREKGLAAGNLLPSPRPITVLGVLE